jgi:signal transduction histidine kinase
VQLTIDVPKDLPAVEGDPNLLEQAFLNLALNACQAMPNGGRISINARVADDRMVAIEVRDTGTGIAPEHLSRIFDLYFTTKPSGSGIGLSLVFRTIQLHDGEVDVESTPGRGTTFRVLLRQAPRMFQGLGG